MIVKIDDWIFDVDMTATMEYSAKEAAEHCDCAYCRNFYATVDTVCSELRPFLAQFGVDIEAPDELMPYVGVNEIICDGFYAVSGRILQVGKKPLEAAGIEIHPLEAADIEIHPEQHNALHINTSCPQPYFFLNFEKLTLPWVLDEPMEDVISPANLPSFLKRMWDRLLRRQKKDIMSS